MYHLRSHRNLSLPYLLKSVHPTRDELPKSRLVFLRSPEAGGSRPDSRTEMTAPNPSDEPDSFPPSPAPSDTSPEIISKSFVHQASSASATHPPVPAVELPPGPLPSPLGPDSLRGDREGWRQRARASVHIPDPVLGAEGRVWTRGPGGTTSRRPPQPPPYSGSPLSSAARSRPAGVKPVAQRTPPRPQVLPGERVAATGPAPPSPPPPAAPGCGSSQGAGSRCQPRL